MEANELIRELRISNYVLYKGNIVAWDCDDFSEVENGNIMEFVQPIPLTEDILLRFGFEKKNGIYNLEISSSLKIEISEVQGVYYVYLFQYAVHQYDNDQSILLRKDCYVHTLQNVIHSLTGKELELKCN